LEDKEETISMGLSYLQLYENSTSAIMEYGQTDKNAAGRINN